jgi:hypothetical protein
MATISTSSLVRTAAPKTWPNTSSSMTTTVRIVCGQGQGVQSESEGERCQGAGRLSVFECLVLRPGVVFDRLAPGAVVLGRACSAGVPINDVSAVMSHEQTSTTLDRYTHPSRGPRRPGQDRVCLTFR